MELPFAADQLERVRPDSSRQVADVRVPDTLVSRLRLMPEAASVPVTFNRNNTTHVLTTREQRGFADVLELYDLLRRRPPQPAEAAPAPDTARP